jgi:hypothetical protein
MKNDIDTIKKILLKLFKVDKDLVTLNAFIFMDKELLELLKELKGEIIS